jgi:hypothetical protein
MLVLLVATTLPKGALGASKWNEIKSDHFILYERGGERRFLDRLLQLAESYYDKMAEELGYSRRGGFWLWDNRCRIYLYESKEAYQNATRQPGWSSGYAIPERRIIVSYHGSEEFLDSTLPHEMAHLIFREFIGGRRHIPLWLDEGVAMAQEEKRREEFDRVVQQTIREKSWIPLKSLNKIRTLKEMGTDEAALFYTQSQSLVRYLLASEGSEHFVQFCRDLRDGKTLEEAVRKNYSYDFRSTEELESKWVSKHRSNG